MILLYKPFVIIGSYQLAWAVKIFCQAAFCAVGIQTHFALPGKYSSLITTCILNPCWSLSTRRSGIWIWMADLADLGIYFIHSVSGGEGGGMGTDIPIRSWNQWEKPKSIGLKVMWQQMTSQMSSQCITPLMKMDQSSALALDPCVQPTHDRKTLTDKKNSSNLGLDYGNACQAMIYVEMNKMHLLLCQQQ